MKLIGSIFWISLCVLAFLVAAIAVNQEKVSLSFLYWRTPFELSLFWWLFGVFLAGSVYGSLFGFGMMSKEDRLEHVEILTNLLEKQKVMYTRLSLSDDPQAVEMKENLRKSVAMMGFPPETDMTMLFSSMKATIDALKQYIDS